jgi:FkbM family methyltransferase
VHIEPVRAYADLLRADRPDETVLEVALGETDGTMLLNVIEATGLSTAVQEYAARHAEQGDFAVKQVAVPVLTLQSALRSLEGKAVHWLKIDVEGFEEQVLKGWDSRVLRPWVMVVEATIPNSTATDYDRWDPIVLAAGYSFVYFDGLNRFYLADEHAHLRPAFGMPPNVFDDLQVSGQGTWPLCGLAVQRVREDAASVAAAAQAAFDSAAAAARADFDNAAAALEQKFAAAEVARREDSAREQALLSAKLAACEDERDALNVARDALNVALAEHSERYDSACARNAVLAEEAAQAAIAAELARAETAAAHARTHEWWTVADRFNHRLQAIEASRSWRMTAPVRSASALLRVGARLPRRIAGALWRRGSAFLRRALGWALRAALRNRLLGGVARALLRRFPRLAGLLRDLAGRAGLLQAVAGVPSAAAAQSGSPLVSARAARLLSQLEHALDARKN